LVLLDDPGDFEDSVRPPSFLVVPSRLSSAVVAASPRRSPEDFRDRERDRDDFFGFESEELSVDFDPERAPFFEPEFDLEAESDFDREPLPCLVAFFGDRDDDLVARRLSGPRTGTRSTKTQPIPSTGLAPMRRPSSNNHS